MSAVRWCERGDSLHNSTTTVVVSNLWHLFPFFFFLNCFGVKRPVGCRFPLLCLFGPNTGRRKAVEGFISWSAAVTKRRRSWRCVGVWFDCYLRRSVVWRSRKKPARILYICALACFCLQALPAVSVECTLFACCYAPFFWRRGILSSIFWVAAIWFLSHFGNHFKGQFVGCPGWDIARCSSLPTAVVCAMRKENRRNPQNMCHNPHFSFGSALFCWWRILPTLLSWLLITSILLRHVHNTRI